MRRPGSFLLRLADTLGLARLRETVLLPAVADMQHECGEEGSARRRQWTLLRGYWAIATGCAFYTTQLPWRHLRQNWASIEAPGPRLLRAATPVASLVGLFLLVISLVAWPNERGLGLSHFALLIPSMTSGLFPLSLAMGVGWTLARNPSMARAALGVGVLGAGLSFVFFDVAVTKANQEYRVTGYQALKGRADDLPRGSREMTIRELGEATSGASWWACPPPASKSGCAAFLRTEWHNRLSLPAFAFSFVILAAALSRNSRRAVILAGLFFTYSAAHALMRIGEQHGVQGDVPVALAAWIPQLVPLGLAGFLHLMAQRRLSTVVA